MFAKKLLQKTIKSHHPPPHDGISCLTSADLNLRIAIHYGIPSTASLLAFDPIQRLLAIGTLDGRIKVIGGDNIEGVLASPKQLPLKYLEFLQNKGVLISISNDNDIQIWNLENRCIDCSLQWESNITAFSVIHGSCFIYVGDEHGLTSVLKYDAENEKLLQLPYHISASSLTEAAGISFADHQPIVGLLPQPCSSGNRVLIAFENGMIILWDVVESRVIAVRGDKVLQLQNAADSLNQGDGSPPHDASEHHVEEKEISALCWASSTGSIVAVGYIDGDILFWKTWTDASGRGHHHGSSNAIVVKLQLSCAERRIPVIVLNWCPDKKSHKDGDGKLFIYGGDEIGSEEVLTVLTLEWSPGYETLRCVDRVDLTLAGSFADMTLLPIAGATGSNNSSALCVLTNPGQIQIFDITSLSALASQHEMKMNVSAMEFPVVIPTVEPLMTVAEVFRLPGDRNSSTGLSKIATVGKLCSKPTLSMGGQWPLTGGVCNHLAFAEDNRIERLYVAGYQDGSIRIWDATYPVLSLLCIFEGEVETIEVADLRASVLKVVFCFDTLSLAVGNECGLVRLYDLNGSLDKASLHFVSETEHRVHNLPQSEGPCCRALFSLLSSPVHALEFANHGAKLIVGYGCGRVAVLDTSALSALFITDCMSNPSLPAISVTTRTISHVKGHDKSPLDSGSNDADYHTELIFVLTKDAKVYVLDSKTGKMVSSQPTQSKESDAISLHVIEGHGSVSELSNEKHAQQQSTTEPIKDLTASGSVQHEAEHISLLENTPSEHVLNDSLVLLCSKDILRVYPIKSVVQGGSKSLYKVKLAKPCCWTTALLKAEKVCGLVLLYETGDIEIRSLPDLDLVKETSLMSILRWNYKANMARTMSSTDNGHITLANGCEVAFISVLASENDFRIPESLPCLHDKVLAAAADAALNFSTNQKKKQGIGPALLGGIVKGFKGGRPNYVVDLSGSSKSIFSHLEDTFSKQPFTDAVSTNTNEQETLNLDIDEIEIDEPANLASTSASFENLHNNEGVKHNERDKLFDGGDAKPRLRTREEIIAKYRKAEDASSAAGQARNKLLERQEKLERISKRTEELQSGAEDFASLANELVKAMESRKWWQI